MKGKLETAFSLKMSAAVYKQTCKIYKQNLDMYTTGT